MHKKHYIYSLFPGFQLCSCAVIFYFNVVNDCEFMFLNILADKSRVETHKGVSDIMVFFEFSTQMAFFRIEITQTGKTKSKLYFEL